MVCSPYYLPFLWNQGTQDLNYLSASNSSMSPQLTLKSMTSSSLIIIVTYIYAACWLIYYFSYVHIFSANHLGYSHLSEVSSQKKTYLPLSAVCVCVCVCVCACLSVCLCVWLKPNALLMVGKPSNTYPYLQPWRCTSSSVKQRWCIDNSKYKVTLSG